MTPKSQPSSCREFSLLIFVLLTLISTNLWATGPKVSLLGTPWISTLAGQGWDTSGYTGDGGPASAATLYYPYGVTVDSSGNVYIADSNNYAIRVVNTQNVAITVFGVTIQPGNIATVAGTGTEGYTGDTGPATSAQIGWITGVALDGNGNLYFADNTYQVVRKIATGGTISTFAGTPYEGTGCVEGSNSDNGDGGPATSAAFECIYGIATDGSGNVYISDSWSGLIRQVNSQGVINTVAGNKSNNPYCDASSASGDGGSALSATFGCPISVRTDQNGNLYIADYDAGVIHVVNMQASAITVAGVSIPVGDVNIVAGVNNTCDFSGDGGPATSADLCEPYDAWPDRQGNLFIADSDNDVIRKVTSSGTISTFAGTFDTWDFTGDGGPATSATLYYPTSVSGDTLGNIYIADDENNAIRKVSPNGGGTTQDLGSISLGSNTTQMVQLYMNQAVTISAVAASGDYAITTAPNQSRRGWRRVRKSVSTPSGMPAFLAKLRKKSRERRASRTRVAHPNGASGNGVSCIGTFNQADICTTWVKFTPAKPGPRWFQLTVTDNNENNYKFGLTGTGIGSLVSITPGIINTPAGATEVGALTGMARDSGGNLYVADYMNHVISKITPQGVVSTYAGISGTPGYDGDGGPATSAHLYDPFGLTFDSTGNLYIADTLNNVIRKVDVNGIITTVAGNGTAGYSGDGSLATDAELYNPLGVLADTAGNLYVADSFNNVVRFVTLAGQISTIAGNGYGAGTGGWYGGGIGNGTGGWWGDGGAATSAELFTPTGLVLDASGNLYIADTQNSAIRKVDTTGNISTVAGLCGEGCTYGYSGDGGPATSAALDFPMGLAVDPAGDFYIADTDNSVVRKVDVNGIITTIAGGISSNSLQYRGNKLNWRAYAKPRKARRLHGQSVSPIGDGGLATSATIGIPVSVLLDNSGSFYFTDVVMGDVRVVDVTTSDMNLGSLNPGTTSSPMTAAVSNTGNATLNVSQITLSTHFGWGDATTCGYPSTLSVGDSCLVSADFTPPAAGNYSGSMVVTDDAFTSPHTVTLEGVGTQPDYSVTATPASLTITQGQSGTATLTVTPIDGYAGTITFSCTGLPALSACVFSPTSAVFDGSTTTPVTVTLTVNTTGKSGMASLAAPPRPTSQPGAPLYALLVPLALAGAVLLGSANPASNHHRSHGRPVALGVLLTFALLAGIVFMNACGDDSHAANITPVGTYTSTVTTSATANGGSAQHQATITITIVQ